MFYLLTCVVLCIAYGTGSLEKPQKSEAMQLKTSPESKKSTDSPQTRDRTSPVSTPGSRAPQSLSSPSGSSSSTSSQESDEMIVTKPLPPPGLFPSRLSNAAKPLQPKVSNFLLVEGKMSPVQESSTMQDVESVPSVSSGTSSDKNDRQSPEHTCGAVRVGSDISSEPLTFHTDFGDGCTAAISSDEERRNLEDLATNISKSGSESLDVNENIGKKGSADSHSGVKDSDMVSDYQKLNGHSDSLKMISGLFDKSQYLPVTTSTIVVNMVHSVVTRPEDQNSTAMEPGAANANHSQDNSECDMSISDEASPNETPSRVSPDVTTDKESQQEKTSSSTVLISSDHANDVDKNNSAEEVPSSDGGTDAVQVRSKLPVSEKGDLHSKSGKRNRSRSSERKKKHRSRSREKKKDRSDRQSDTTSVTKSPVQRETSRKKDRKRSRSSSRSRRRRSSSREERSHTSRTSSHSSRRRERSHSRSRENRKKRSRSRSNDSRRRSRSTDRGRHKRETRSRSKDRSRRSDGKDRRSSRDDDSVRRVFVRQADRASPSSKTHQSDRSRESPRHQCRSPSRTEKAATRRDERASHEKSGKSKVEKAVTSRQSDSDLSSAESGRQHRTRDESPADNNRIAVISSSSGTNRRPTHEEEFESDEDPPSDPPAAYDPSEPTEDNFRDSRKVSDHRGMPSHWVPPGNQRMPMVDMSRPPPVFSARLPPPPPARFPHGPPQEAVTLDISSGRPAPPPMITVPPPLPRPTEVQPPMSYSRPLLTAPAGIMPQPPSVQAVRIPRGVNVDAVPLIVRGPVEPARLIFVPPGVGQPVRLEAASVVGLPRIICPPGQGNMADLVRLPLGQPPPRPGSLIPAPPFVSGNQMMIRPAPMVFQQVPLDHRTDSPQSAPQIITNLPVSQIARMSAAGQPLVSSMAEVPFPPGSGHPTLPNMPLPPGRPSQPQSAPALSSSSASSPSSGSQDAEDLLLERYSAKPEPPRSLFPSQKPPDPPKPAVDAQKHSPDPISEESEKSSDQSLPPNPPQPPQPPPPSDAVRATVATSSEVVPTSASESLPSDPRLLVQYLLKQARQTPAASDRNNSPAGGDHAAPGKPSAPQELHSKSEKIFQELMENSPEKPDKNKIAYSPSQADWGDDDMNLPSENVREMKVCLCLLTCTTQLFGICLLDLEGDSQVLRTVFLSPKALSIGNRS